MALLLALLLVIAGCGSSQKLPEPEEGEHILAYRSHNFLMLRILPSEPDQESQLWGGQWPEPADDKENAPRYLTAALLPLGKQAFADEVLLQETRKIPVRPQDEWQNMSDALINQLAPEQMGFGRELDARNFSLVAYRNRHGQAVLGHADTMPEDIKLVEEKDSPNLVKLLNDWVKSSHREASDGEPQIFTIEANSYLYVDPVKNEAVFLMTGSEASVVENQLFALGNFMETLNSVVWRSHILLLAKNPGTFLGRGLSMSGEIVRSLLHSDVQEEFPEVPPLNQKGSMDLAAWERELDELTGRKAALASMDILIDGEAYFKRLEEAIQQSQQDINFRTYIFDNDQVAVNVADTLKAKSTEVDIRVLVDDLGSFYSAGVKDVHAPSDFEPPDDITEYLTEDSRIDLRESPNPWFTGDHNKVILIDRQTAFIGGMNIGREYRYDWHDMMLELRGPAVKELYYEYEKAWAHAGWGGDYALLYTSRERPTWEVETPPDAFPVRTLYTSTTRSEIRQAQLGAIERAQQRIYVQNPYLSDNEFFNALVRARHRGVDVRVVLPGINSVGMMAQSNEVTANRLIEEGVRVFIYPGMTHIKALLVDGWVSTGSANFDMLSLRVNQETNIAFSDPTAVERFHQEVFAKDFSVSREMQQGVATNWLDYASEFFANQL